jgi:hypothetical protein
MAISGDIIQKLLRLLRPHLQDEKERKGYLIMALGTNTDALNLIWNEPVNIFVPHMVQELVAFGEATPGKPALCALLEVIRENVGVDTQDSIDKLLLQIREELQKAEITGKSLPTTDALIEQVKQDIFDPNRYIFLKDLLLQESKALAGVMQGELEACPWELSLLIHNKQQCQQCIEYLEAKSERFVRILATIIHHDHNAQFITPVAKALKALAIEPVPINTACTYESRWVRLYPLALAIYTVFIVGVQEEREQLLRKVLETRCNRQAASLPDLPIVYVLSYLDGYSHSIFNAVLGTPYFAPVAERIKIILFPWLEELLLDADAAFYQGEFVLGLANIEAPYYLSDKKRLSLQGLYLYYPEARPILKAFLCGDSSQWLVSLYPSLEDLLDIFDTTASKLDRSGFGRMSGFCSGAVAAFRGEV